MSFPDKYKSAKKNLFEREKRAATYHDTGEELIEEITENRIRDTAFSLVKMVLLLLAFFSLTRTVFSQGNDPMDDNLDVSGAVSITNQGISIVPALSLGKPAALYNFSVGKRFRFEPELNFAMEGDPWSFLLWLRYDLLENEKFSLTAGVHPGYSFRKVPALTVEAENSEEITEVLKYLAGDLSTRYSITNNVDTGVYYLQGHGLETAEPDQIHYLSLYTSFSDILLFSRLYLDFSPEIYYLKIDEIDGIYAASGITLGIKDIPITVSSTINKIIESKIENDDPLWNISLNYSFRF